MKNSAYIRIIFYFIIAVLAIAASVGVNASKTQTLKKKLGNVEQKIQTVKKQIRQKEGEAKTVLGQLISTERELERAQTRLSQNKIKLMDAQADLAETIKRLEITKRQLARRQKLLENRIVDIYQGEDLSYANVVLGATDMWTFLTRAYYLKEILDMDTRLVNQIREDKEQIERDKARKARRVREISSLQVKLIEERDNVAMLAESKREQLEAIENSKELYEKALDELLAESQRIENEIRRIQSTPKGRARYARSFKGGLSLPIRGRITSRFGYRVHPITGVYKLHTGVDISACTGTPIAAAASGVVIMAGWMGAYGNAVVIDHGGGVSTLYGHCSRVLVNVGDNVKKGETIGLVGSTGYSTGPHLHFEKRINGTPVNPL